MTFKKLALAAAVALVPTAGFSMEVLDDSALSSVTGQDGVEINITSAAGIGADIVIHDTDGFTGAVEDGAIVMQGFLLTLGAGGININIDAGDQTVAGAAGSATLNINVSIPTGTQIVTGNLQVANSGRDESSWGFSNPQTVMNSMTITLGVTTLNIQLGNELQDVAGAGTSSTSHMIALETTIGSGGIGTTGFALNDNDPTASGSIGATGVTRIINAGGDDATGSLDVKIGINATSAGLVLEIGQLGTVANGIDVRMTDMYLGASTAGIVGDVSINNLKLAGTVVTISGK